MASTWWQVSAVSFSLLSVQCLALCSARRMFAGELHKFAVELAEHVDVDWELHRFVVAPHTTVEALHRFVEARRKFVVSAAADFHCRFSATLAACEILLRCSIRPMERTSS